jgi:RNA polymerase sigma factor (TIGR02999 family)
MKTAGQVTQLLGEVAAGNREAHDQLWSLMEGNLRRIARRLARCRDARLQPTEIVNEAYAEFAARERPTLATEVEFRRYVTRVMKNVVGEAARSRKARKRSGPYQRESLTGQPLVGRSPEKELIVQNALEQLRKSNPRAADAVEYQQYGGMEVELIAEALHVGRTAAVELLAFGKASLRSALEGIGI